MNWNREIVLALPMLTRAFFLVAVSAFVLGLSSCGDRASGPRELTFGHVGEPGSLGGQWQVDANFLALTRTDGTNTRLSLIHI